MPAQSGSGGGTRQRSRSAAERTGTQVVRHWPLGSLWPPAPGPLAPPTGPTQDPSIVRDDYGAHWVSPDHTLPWQHPAWGTTFQPEIVRRNALKAAAAYDRLEAHEIPAIVEVGSLSWEQGGHWTPCLLFTFSEETKRHFPTPVGALAGTCYAESYPFHATSAKDRSWLREMKEQLEAAFPDGRCTVKLVKASTGFGRTAYVIAGGSLGDLLETDFWQGVRQEGRPWHISL